MSVKSICVFCGARLPNNKNFIQVAKDCGKLFGEYNINLVYGGAGIGLMGAVSDAAYKAGSYVLGVYPKYLHEREPLSQSVSESKIVDSMFERKKIMLERSDAFLVLPGGVGTLDEVFEVITLKSLGVITQPLIFINVDGYWDILNTMLAHMVDNGMAGANIFDTYNFVSSPEEALRKFGISK